MEKTKFYALRTNEDGNLEFDVKLKLERKFKDIYVFVPLKKTRVKIDSSYFGYYERLMPDYLLFSYPELTESTIKKIGNIKGVENILMEKSSSGADIVSPLEDSEISKIIKSTPNDQELISFYGGLNTNVIFGQYAGYSCEVAEVNSLVASIVIPSKSPIKVNLPVWYLGKEEI